ncbi:MAG: anhydro-N-acetylmuramic acid kinase [Luminiphilus sp.]|nr:anhydro-N-acetylmuramic acid kinase [Luminiphilus sp.]
MSGTSADGIDAVLISTGDGQSTLTRGYHRGMPHALRDEILSFRQPGDNELDRLAVLDRQLADEYATAIKALLNEAGVCASDVTAIGSHGQTLRHQPGGETPYTVQIGDPNRLAELTGVTVVADFRRRDMAAGGEGAPLVPAFHRARLIEAGVPSAVVNIGGIANVTLISAEGTVRGWDTGPGNTLLDGWISQHQGQLYDAEGSWASTGQVLEPLLNALLADPYFSRPNPKSTGPEYFRLDWLERSLTGEEAPENVQRTLLELTVMSICDALSKESVEVVRLCGGGAYNTLLRHRLAERMPSAQVTTTTEIGVDPQWVEAWAFAWLAEQTLASLPGNVPAVTGAAGERVLGGIYPAGG